jgi:peptide-methionine (S)-S-oxide reductase
MRVQRSKMVRQFVILMACIAMSNLSVASVVVETLPATKAASTQAPKTSEEIAVFAGGCFWGIEAVFEHVKGVNNVWSGYAGGSAMTANYSIVSSGMTDHAESVKISYDPSKVSYGTLLRIFFSVAHDPTQLNRQGPDTGKQYRSAIFYTSPQQERIAKAYIAQLTAAQSFAKPIVTQVKSLDAFYLAEDYHQNFARLNPNHPYIVYHDKPKVANLKQKFPQIYKAE